MRQQRQGHGMASVVGAGIGVFRRPGQADPYRVPQEAVAIASVVEHGDTEVGLGEIDVAMGAHLELGGIPRRRGMGRPAHGSELDTTRRRIGVHVDREAHRQQVLIVMPVEVDLDVEAR